MSKLDDLPWAEPKRGKRIRFAERMQKKAERLYRRGLYDRTRFAPERREAVALECRAAARRNRDHLSTCSSICCGNPRRWFGEQTIQERRAAEDADEQFVELLDDAEQL